MKKRKWIRMLAAVLVLIFCITGCNKSKSDESAAAKKEEQNTEKKDNPTPDEDKKPDATQTEEQKPVEDNESTQPDINAEPSLNEVRIIVFYGSDDATAFVKEEAAINSLSPEAVLKALIDKGVVPADVSVLDFKTTEADGKNSIEIDFNNAFSAHVKTMGTTGEYYAIGSVCNTFLNAYNCQRIKITVEGSELTTGHAEYPGYMTMFE